MADSRPSRIFGITSELSGVAGYIINSYSENETVETARAQDERGKVLDIARIYSEQRNHNGSSLHF